MTTQRGYVYSGILDSQQLQALLEMLALGTVLSWNLARLDFSGDLREGGTAFGPKGEVRWRRHGEGAYAVLALWDEQVEGLPLEGVPGEWQTEGVITSLVNLDAPQFCPQFAFYPQVESKQARLRCRIFLRDGMPMFVSPREVLREHVSSRS